MLMLLLMLRVLVEIALVCLAVFLLVGACIAPSGCNGFFGS